MTTLMNHQCYQVFLDWGNKEVPTPICICRYSPTIADNSADYVTAPLKTADALLS